MQIQLRKSSTDSDMLEIISIEEEKKEKSDTNIEKERTFLWAVCHFDFVYRDQDIFKRLKEGESITFELHKIKK